MTTLIDNTTVISLAYSSAEYTPEGAITDVDITTAERRYIVPVIGEALYASLLAGDYSSLLADYVAPALALFVREVADVPSAPSSKGGMVKARTMLWRLSDYLDDNAADYSEYDESANILKRCRINGVHIQIR